MYIHIYIYIYIYIIWQGLYNEMKMKTRTSSLSVLIKKFDSKNSQDISVFSIILLTRRLCQPSACVVLISLAPLLVQP